MTSNATYSRTITVDLPDFASKSLAFTLLTSVAIDAANNVTQLRRLHNGAIWQLAQRIAELEAQLGAITA